MSTTTEPRGKLAKQAEADEPRKVKVKLRTSRVVQTTMPSGKPGGLVSQAPGDIVEMTADEAERNIAAGHCSPVE